MEVITLINIKSFGIIGGDKRQLAAARTISSEGYTVYLSGFEKLEQLLGTFGGSTTIENAAKLCDAVILPLPVTKDSKTLNAPFSQEPINLNDDFAKLFSGKKVFCAMKEALMKTSSLWNDDLVFDYLNREELQVNNAVPTAEGAIEIAMREYLGTINGSKCLVTGFGRIGKVLAKMLKGLGADVSVSARKKSDLSWINLLGYNPVEHKELINCQPFDIIFNTVPALVINAHILAKIAQNAVVIDLASKPGGVDFESAGRMGILTVHALSLPGKVAPKTSGEIIKNTVFNILEENEK